MPTLLLVAGIALTFGVRKQHEMSPRAAMNTIPVSFAEYSSRDTVVSEEEQKVAGMTDYVMRSFWKDSMVAFTIYVGYYDRQVQGKSIHSPKNCLPGAGWQIMQTDRVPLAGTNASGNRVLLANGRARALVYYWYQGRGRIEPSEYRVKWDLLRDAAVYGRTEESLVRIVVPLDMSNNGAMPTAATLARAELLVSSVIRPLIPAVYQAMPQFPGA
ncbi:MAG: exosortase C-terminal domain/associated protein EpsI [Gemmatimonas sp.]